MLTIAAIIPVKTFSKAKSRLKIPQEAKIELCKIMFEELLNTLSISPLISKVIIVTKDSKAVEIAKKFNTVIISDDKEDGVNKAVSLADEYIKKK